MSRVVELLCSRRVPHVAVLALMSFGFAGCSADMSTRLSQNYLLQSLCLAAEATGSVPAPAGRAARTAAIFAAAISNISPARCRRRSAAPQSYPTREQRACPEEGAGSPPMLRRRIRIETTGTVAAALGCGGARPAQAAPRSSSAPATRSSPGAPL